MGTVLSFDDPSVETAFSSFPDPVRIQLLALRSLIFDVAARTEGVGDIEETLKWGQPAYLTPVTKSGSTIRLGQSKRGGAALFAHCQTTIISDFQTIFPDEFDYEGNRAIRFKPGHALPLESLELLVHRALTYHLKAKH